MKCITPLTIRNPMTNQSFPADCGRCYICVKKRASQWSFRLRKEGEASCLSLFVTLTYDTIHVPITKNGFMTLSKTDVTLFFRRLRRLSKQKIKYYYVGEYGGQTNRPHYHLLLFNAEHEDIEKAWTLGAIHYGTVSGASIGYTLKYMCKDGKIPMHRNDDRIKEFGRMSKGIGISYITERTKNWHTNNRTILDRCNLTIDEKKIAMPRYYKDKIYSENQKLQLQFKAKELEEIKWLTEDKEDIQRKIQAQIAETRKLHADKYKNKFI